MFLMADNFMAIQCKAKLKHNVIVIMFMQNFQDKYYDAGLCSTVVRALRVPTHTCLA